MTYNPWTFDIQFAPTFTPMTPPTSGDWVSLGAPFALSIRRGRQDDLDEFEAGTMEVVLDNADESLDQLLSTSDIYDTEALPFTPMRLVATKGIDERVLFTGFTLDGFTPEGLRGGGRVSVKVVDWLGWAASVVAQDSQWGAWCGFVQPAIWSRCQSRRTFSNYDDNPNGTIYNAAAIWSGDGYDFEPDTTYPSFVYRTMTGIVYGADKPAVNLGDISPGTTFGGMIVPTSRNQADRWIAAGWFQIDNPQTVTWAGSDWSVTVNGSGHVVATVDVNGSSESDTVTVDHADSEVHMWLLSVSSVGASRSMRIETDLGNDSHSFAASGASGGGYLNFRGLEFFNTTVGDFVYFDGDNLDDIFALGVTFGGLTPYQWVTGALTALLWSGDTFSERIDHVAGAVGAGVPDYQIRTEAAHELVSYQPTSTLATDIRAIGAAYLGATYMLRDGTLRVRDASFTNSVSLESSTYDFSLVEARISDESADTEWTATVADTFTRADSSGLGGNWVTGALSGTFGIISNAAYVSNDSTGVPMHYYQDLGRDVTVTCDFSNEVVGQGVIVRRADVDSYIAVTVGSGTVDVTAFLPGGSGVAIGDTGGDAMGSSLTVTVDDDTLTVQIDSGTVHEFTITDPELMSGTGVGLVYTDIGVLPANTARWDNFSAECIRPLIRPSNRSRTGTRVDRVYNAISADYGGAPIYYQDADSIARYGYRELSFDTIASDLDTVETYVADVLAAKKDPVVEVGELTIRPWGNQYLTDWAMRDLELERAVQYREALYMAGTEVLDATYRVAGESWDYASGVDWTITLKIVPA